MCFTLVPSGVLHWFEDTCTGSTTPMVPNANGSEMVLNLVQEGSRRWVVRYKDLSWTYLFNCAAVCTTASYYQLDSTQVSCHHDDDIHDIVIVVGHHWSDTSTSLWNASFWQSLFSTSLNGRYIVYSLLSNTNQLQLHVLKSQGDCRLMNL